MPISPEYKAFVEELFERAFPVRIRAMFGGAGIYSGDVMFGLISDERIYLKADGVTRLEFEAEGSKPFVFTSRAGDIVAMSYLELPERLYDEPNELRLWAMKALDVAMKGNTAKRKAKKAVAGKPKAIGKKTRAKPRRPRKGSM